MQIENNCNYNSTLMQCLPKQKISFKGNKKYLGKAASFLFKKVPSNKSAKITEVIPNKVLSPRYPYFYPSIMGITMVPIANSLHKNTTNNNQSQIRNLHQQICDATTKEELYDLQKKCREFHNQYPDCNENFAIHIKQQLNKLFPDNIFANEARLQNLNEYTIGGNQSININITDTIILGSNGYKVNLHDPAIKMKLLFMQPDESLSIGTENYPDKVDEILKNTDSSIPPSKITITKGQKSFILNTDPKTKVKIYSKKQANEINLFPSNLPQEIQNSIYTIIEYKKPKEAIKILQSNNIKTTTDFKNQNGIIKFIGGNVEGELIYINGKLHTSKINNIIITYNDNKERRIDNKVAYNNAISYITEKNLETQPTKYIDYSNINTYKDFIKGQPTIIDNNARIELCDQYIFSMNEEPFKNMNNNSMLVLGKNSKIPRFSNYNFLATNQLIISKQNDKYIITSLIDNGAKLIPSKRMATPASEIEKEIKTGQKTEILNNQHLKNDSPVYKNIKNFSEYLSNKIEKQMGITTPDEISEIVDQLCSQYNLPKQDILNIIARLTQFGNYRQLEKLGQILEEQYNIGKGYNESEISINNILNYLGKTKFQIPLDGYKECFILDDAGLKYIENLSTIEKEKLLTEFETEKVIPINLDGINFYIGNNNYTYTAFDGAENLMALTKAIIEELNKNKSLDEILNNKATERLNKVFGIDLSRLVKTIYLNQEIHNTPLDITKQINPNYPSSKDIENDINTYINQKLNLYGTTSEKLKIVFAKYIDNLIKTLSNNSLIDILKEQHHEIEKYVSSIGETMDNVYYIYPYPKKSFGLINYMYMKANNIDISHFLNTNGENMLPRNKVFVLLDDISASGTSMLTSQFSYNDFIKYNRSAKLIFSPLISTNIAKDKIQRAIQNNKRQDVLISNPQIDLDVNKFKSSLSSEEQNLLEHYICQTTYGSNAICISFPYMIPDNCSVFGGYILDKCLNNSKANKTKKLKIIA